VIAMSTHLLDYLKNGPALLTLAGAVVAAFGVFWSAARQADISRQLREKTEQIAGLNQELNVRSTETLNQITGGDSFIYFEPLRRDGRLALFLRHDGAYPAFDVTLRLHEGNKLLALPIFVGTVRRGSGFDWITFPPLELPAVPASGDERTRDYRIEISARNGIFIHHIRVQPVKGQWRTDSHDLTKAGQGPIALPASFKEAQDQP
jgi:hypothetical protein